MAKKKIELKNQIMIKIIAPIEQSSVKFGVSFDRENLNKTKDNPNVPPKALLRHLKLPRMSVNHEMMCSQGRTKEALESLQSVGYLDFITVPFEDLGIFDPTNRGRRVKMSIISYNPDYSTPDEFIKGINWLIDKIRMDKRTFPGNIKVYRFNGLAPIEVRESLDLNLFLKDDDIQGEQ